MIRRPAQLQSPPLSAAARHDETMPTEPSPRWLMVETSGRNLRDRMDFPEMCSKYFGLQTPPRDAA